MRIAVFGATGRTGQYVLAQGLARGHELTAFGRRVEKLEGMSGRIQKVRGDGLNLEEVRGAVSGQEAVISTVPLSGVARNIVAAMQGERVRRCVVVSAYPVVATRPWLTDQVHLAFLRQSLSRQPGAWKRSLRKSGLDWTIVRPPRADQWDPTKRVRVEPKDNFDSCPYSILAGRFLLQFCWTKWRATAMSG